jgi:molybdopterin converting factor small subunit
MKKATIQLPRVFSQIAQGHERKIEVCGDTLAEVLDDLIRQRPWLEVHLFDEARELRPHIRLVCNKVYTGGQDDLDTAIGDGDTIAILNAVSGG